jgi:hypothetical protein
MAPNVALSSAVRRSPRLIALRMACVAVALALASAIPGLAFNPVAQIDVGPNARFAAGRLPAGGYLLVWQDTRRSDFRLTAQRFTAAGRPTAPAKLLDVGATHGSLAVASVAVGDTGAWAVFWAQATDPDEIGIGAAFYDAQDRLQQWMVYDDPIPDPGELIISYSPHGIALAGGGYVVAVEVGTQDDPTADPLQPTRTDVYVMKLDAAGRKVGDAMRLNETAQGFHRLTGVGGSRNHIVVTWDAVPVQGQASAVRARFLDGNLAPLGPEVHVAEPDGSPGGSGLAVGPDGQALMVWEGTDTNPVGGPPGRGIRMRAFGPAGEPVGVEHAVNPGTPGDHVAPDIALTAEGIVWVGWTTPGNLNPSGDGFESVLSLRPFDLAGNALAGAQDVAQAGFAVLTGGRGGALVTWRSGPGGSTVLGFVVGPAGGQSGPPSAPFAIEGAELTDFRAWVRFSPRDFAASWGTPLEPCLAQALCTAGLLPTRAEVIVRVIGPSANGFLWPQIVRFTTDPAEVWVQRKASGEVRYYALPAGDPGTEVLTGRVDRHGFRP